ncbi:MAG: stage III sporulation protein AG [Oscillospiraceae bacterium]|nr:stage III sporulation protein AG [Oscillospiraceae bacterium]
MKICGEYLTKLPAILDRYKYPALILLIGILLVLLPAHQKEAAVPESPETSEAESGFSEGDYRARMEQELSELLSQVEGAGRVKVMLTLKMGPAARYQTDRSVSSSREGEKESQSSEERTVMIGRGSAYDEPAVVSTAYPVFQGALVVAEGGADPSVRYQLSAAVAALLGLGADQITVVKMK